MNNKEREKRAASMRALFNEEGPIYIWALDETKEKVTNLHRFTTEEDARKYIDLARAEMNARGWKPAPYVVGTAEEYEQTAAKCDKARRAGEAKRYREFVNEQNDIERAEIDALEALRKVCLQFDGKVINRRFFAAVNREVIKVNFWCIYNGAKEEYAPAFSLKTCGSYSFATDIYFYRSVWPWLNTSLNAPEAVALIDGLIQERKGRIKEREATIKEFTTYIHKAANLAGQLAQLLKGTNKQLATWTAANVQELRDIDTLGVLRVY